MSGMSGTIKYYEFYLTGLTFLCLMCKSFCCSTEVLDLIPDKYLLVFY